MKIKRQPDPCPDLSCGRHDQPADMLPCGIVRAAAWRGFSLLELMISMTISLFLVGGLSFVLANAHKINRLQNDGQIQNESGRYAIDLLSRDLRMAGHYGCLKGQRPEIRVGGNYRVEPLHGLDGDNPGWHPTPKTELSTEEGGNPNSGENPVDNEKSDSIIIRTAAPLAQDATLAAVADPVGTGSADISGIKRGDILLIADCKQSIPPRGDIFSVSGKGEKEIEHGIISGVDFPNTSPALSDYTSTLATEPGLHLYEFLSIKYKLKKDGNNYDIPTLYRQINSKPAQPVIPGVDAMQFLYGKDTGGTPAPDVFVPADQVVSAGVTSTPDPVEEWARVRAVKVALLIRTEQEYGAKDLGRNPYPMQVADFSFADDGKRVRRRVYETTVNLRNSY